MNKIITAFLFVCIVFSYHAKSQTPTPKENRNCKLLWFKKTNSANTVVENNNYSYNDTGKLIEVNGLQDTTKIQYDENGNKIRHTLYTQYLDKTYKRVEIEFAYNIDNQLIRQVSSSAKPPEELRMYQEIIYEYHTNGKLKKMIIYSEDFSSPSTVDYYNENGQIVRSEKSDGNVIKWEYNALNNKTKQTKYDKNNRKTNEQLWEYNSLGQLSRYSKSTERKVNSYVVYRYNADGKVIKETEYDGSGVMIAMRTTVYAGESYTVTTFKSKTESTKSISYEVINGLLRKESEFLNDQLVYYIDYEYDEYRNRVKKEYVRKSNNILIREEWYYACD